MRVEGIEEKRFWWSSNCLISSITWHILDMFSAAAAHAHTRHFRKLSSYLPCCNCSITSKWNFSFLLLTRITHSKILISKWVENCVEDWQHKKHSAHDGNKIYCIAPRVASDFINHFIKFQLLRDVRVQKKLCNKNLIFPVNERKATIERNWEKLLFNSYIVKV